MNQFLIGILLIVSFLCYYLWNENQVLTANNAALETAVATQEEAIQTLQNDFTLQTEQLGELQKKSQEAQREMNRYLDIFKRHNLTKLAAAKPGLIEPRANKATKEVFDGIEEISVGIDQLDDNVVELQPDTN
tara:strand:- start:3049 stop:3447 length:399 start_codon:yes stop_codon:yes gene_type:complete